MTFSVRFSNLLRHGRALRIPHRTLMKLKDEDFSMEFLEGDQKGLFGHSRVQASCDRMDPLCRQRHLSCYRSRTLTLTLILKHPNPIFNPDPYPKNKKNKNDTWIKFNIELYPTVNFIGQGRGGGYKGPITGTYGHSLALVVLYNTQGAYSRTSDNPQEPAVKQTYQTDHSMSGSDLSNGQWNATLIIQLSTPHSTTSIIYRTHLYITAKLLAFRCRPT